MRPLPVTLCAVAALVGLTSGCILEKVERDGAACSKQRTCPRGQECSPDGQCLYPCPETGCSGATCGCGDIDHGDQPSQGGFTCLGGLCHFRCDPNSGGPTGCTGYTACASSRNVCLPACRDDSECAPGSRCHQVGSDPGGGTPQSYCLGTGILGDGGVPDGGARDGAGPDGGVPDGGERYEALVTIGSGVALRGLAAGDGEYVVWADGNDDAIYRCAKSGCAAPTLLGGGGAQLSVLVVELSGQSFFFGSENGMLTGCSIDGCDGGGQHTFVPFGGGGIGLDSGQVFFQRNGHIMACGNPGCTGLRSITTQPLGKQAWAIDHGAAGVFWTVPEDNGAVFGCPFGGCSGDPLELVRDEEFPMALAFLHTYDDTRVFWRSSTAVKYCEGSGCFGPAAVVATFVGDGVFGPLNRLAVAQHGIYWDLQGAIMRCPDVACTGGPKALTQNGASGPHLATDLFSAYFFDGNVLTRYTPP